MEHEKTIHLVMGVSNVGKSSYIKNKKEKEGWKNLPVIMASELDKSPIAKVK